MTDGDDVEIPVGRMRPMRFREWLWLQQTEKTRYQPLAKLVLGGGPRAIWANKPLKPDDLLSDIEGFYASGVTGITLQHLNLMKEAHEEFWDNPINLDDAIADRIAMEKEAARKSKRRSPVKTAIGDLDEPDDDPDLALTTGSKQIATVADSMIPIVKCTWSKQFERIGPDGESRMVTKHCTLNGVNGLNRCELHGGDLIDEEELRNHLRVAAAKLVRLNHLAVDKLEDLMFNSVDDTVQLRAAEALLDRGGFKPGVDVHVHTTEGAEISDPTRSSAAEEIREKLLGLVGLGPDGEPLVDIDVEDAEVVDDDDVE